MICSAKSIRRFLVLTAAACALQMTAFVPEALALKDYMPNKLNVSLLRVDDKSGEAMLRISTIVNLSGCPKVNPLRHVVEVNDIYLDVVIKGYTVDFRELPKAPQYECKQNIQYSAADIPLDRKLIEDNNIQQIRMVLDRGLGSDYYYVNVGKDTIEITPRTQKIFKPARAPQSGQSALKYWYYPENTIILSAPAAPAGKRDDAVIDFANQSGLIPLVNLMPDFTMPAGQEGRHYYVDGTGSIAKKITSRDNAPLNDVVLARRPGLYE
jgi:hypothetical protein